MPRAAQVGRPKTANVFAVEVTDSDSMYVNAAIISVVAKSPTAALASALESFRTAAHNLDKGIGYNHYSISYHGMGTYTVKVNAT